MENDLQSSSGSESEIDLREIFNIFWSEKVKILLITAVFAVSSVFYALSIPNEYRAEIMLTPAQGSSGGLSGALSQLGGLASLAGVNLQQGQSSQIEIAIHIMKSWGFIGDFVSKNGFGAEVTAAVDWNEEANQLIYNEELYDPQKKEWLTKEGAPSVFSLYLAFSGKSSVFEDKMTGLVTVSVDSFSPFLAKEWVDLYVTAINEHMQQREIAKVSRNIEYLQIQIDKTEIKEMQEVLYSIIEEQIKNKMLAEASPDYTFVGVSPSMLPQEKFTPKRAMICIWGTIVGGILSALFVLGRHFLRKID